LRKSNEVTERMNLSLLIPGLCSVLLLTAFSFMFAAQLAPIVLLVASTILLIITYSVHRNQFQSDYRNSTWQQNFQPIAPFVLIAVVLFLAFGYYTISVGPAMVGGVIPAKNIGKASRR
jgi:hypothetical protein